MMFCARLAFEKGQKTKKNKTPASEFDAFTKLVDRVLSVPHAEILRREQEYQKKAEQNPKRRGPKRKVKGDR